MATAGWDVVVVGGANMDYLARGSRLPSPGDTVQGSEFQEAPGGKGANQAVAAARRRARGAHTAGDAGGHRARGGAVGPRRRRPGSAGPGTAGGAARRVLPPAGH